MTKSIKILSLLFLALFLVSNSNAVNYAYNGSTWTPSFTTLSSSDSVTITGGTWILASNTTVKGINLQAGTLSMANKNFTGRIHVSNSAAITSSGGIVTGTIATTGGVLTLGSNLSASRVNLRGGTLSIGTRTLSAPVNVLASSTLNASSSSANIQTLNVSSGTLTVSGSGFGLSDLLLSGGTLNLGAFTLNNGGNLVVTGNSSITGSGFLNNPSDATLTINGGSLSINYAEVLIDKLTFSSANHITVTNGGLLSFNNSSSHAVQNAATDRHVIGTIRVYLDNSSTSLNTYPLGDGSFYAPIKLQPNGKDSMGATLSTVPANGNFGLHYFDLNYVGSKHSITAFDNTLVGASGNEYWTINRSSTKPAASFGFFLNTTASNYGQSAVGNTSYLSADLELAQLNTVGSFWSVLPASVGAAVNGGVPVVTTATMSPNTAFTFASTNVRTNFLTPLPVSILVFSAVLIDQSIDIKWSTASEKDNVFFELEKSIDGQHWFVIAHVNGLKNSHVVNNYDVLDGKLELGMQYYRLKQMDADGMENYSKAIAFNYSKASTLKINIFPNPAKDALYISTEDSKAGELHVQIINAMGEMVYKQMVESGLVQSLDVSSFIPGVYYVTIISESESKIIQLLKN